MLNEVHKGFMDKTSPIGVFFYLNRSEIDPEILLLELLFAIMSDLPPVVHVSQSEIVMICTDKDKGKKSTRRKKQKRFIENVYEKLKETGLSIDRCCYIRFKNAESSQKPVKDQNVQRTAKEKIEQVEKATFSGIDIKKEMQLVMIK